MDQSSFTICYPVRLNDISIDAKIRSWVLFDYLQDAAGRHADQLGLGLKQLRHSDLSWVLSRIRLRMDDFPEYGDTLKITTYPSGFDRLFAYRQFVLSSAETGRRFGVAGSAWLTLNTADFRPVSPLKHLSGLPQWEGNREIFFQRETLDKIPRPETEPILPAEQQVSSAMIDCNRHLNNAFYAMFTEDWLGRKCNTVCRMREIQLNFNQSTGFGEILSCRGTLEEDGKFYVEGLHTGNQKNAFQASGYCETVTAD